MNFYKRLLCVRRVSEQTVIKNGNEAARAGAMGAFTGIGRVIRAVAVAAGLVLCSGHGAQARGPVIAAVDTVRVGTYNDHTRIVMHVNVPVNPKLFTLSNPDRLIIDLPRVEWHMPRRTGLVRSRLIHGYHFGFLTPSTSRLVFNLHGPAQIVDFSVTPLVGKVGYELEIQLQQPVIRPFDRFRLAHNQTHRSDGTPIPGAAGGGLPEAPVVDNATRDLYRQRQFDPDTAEYDALSALFAGAAPEPAPAPPVEEEKSVAQEITDLLSRPEAPLEVIVAEDVPARPAPRREGKVAVMAMAAPEVLAPLRQETAPTPRQREPFRIVIDPGHGGHDPGAGTQVGEREATAVLAFSEELMALLEADPNYDAFATRRSDIFVELSDRVSFARENDADLFISIHADWFDDVTVSGAGAYMLSEEGSIRSIEELVTKKRAETVAGIDIHNEREDVVRVLLDLERRETQVGSRRFAEITRDKLAEVTPLKRNFVKHDTFHVLKAPDLPSVLLELGFMSNPEDRARLTSPEWRKTTAKALKAAIDAWRLERSADTPWIDQDDSAHASRAAAARKKMR